MASFAKIQATVLTTAAVLSLAFGENEIIPSKMYKAKPVFESKYSWESEDRYFFSDYKETLDKYEIIHRFASKMFEDSQELEPSIVEFVSKNFWKIL
jgi:hypothetical protein